MTTTTKTARMSYNLSTPPCTPRRLLEPVGLGFDFAIRTSGGSSASTSSSVSLYSSALRSHWSSDSSVTNSPLLHSPALSDASSLSPPLVPFSTSCDEIFGSSYDLPVSQVSAPSYRHAVEHPNDKEELRLLPSADIRSDPRARFSPFYHDNASQQYLTPPPSPRPLAKESRSRKRKISLRSPAAAEVETRAARTRDNVKRMKTSPALQHLSIFTRAAMAENEDRMQEQAEMMDSLSSMDMDAPSSSRFNPGIPPPKQQQRVDLTLLVSSLPAMSPYPPTPGSTSLPPLCFSSTISAAPTSGRFPDLDYSPSAAFEREIKADVQHRLGLRGLGISADDINVYPGSPSTSCGSSSSQQRMTVVLHTAAAMA
jgi:hypothetical protein